MDIKLGMHVFTSDDRDIGTIDSLIVDPERDTIKSAVIRQGVLLHQDVEVGVETLIARGDGTARIAYTSNEIDTLPHFDQSNYTSPPADYAASMTYPSAALFWPAGYGMGVTPLDPAPAGAMPPTSWLGHSDPIWPNSRDVNREVGDALRRNDVENALIGEGSEVLGRDGEKVGKIRELTFDPDSSRLTHLLVHKGILFGKDMEVPATLIDSVDDGVVYLTVDAKEAGR